MTLARRIAEIRFEDGAWPLWRWDLNLLYLAKSLRHLAAPRSPADAVHFAAVHAYLADSGLTRGPADVTLTAVGDVMWIRSGYADCLSTGIRAALTGADLGLANLETPLDDTRRAPRLVYETLRYNAPPSYLHAWRGTAAQRVFSLCNNHALDQGHEGLANTRRAVLREPMTACVGGPAADDAVVARTIGGARIGVFACTYGINHCRFAPPAGVPVHRLGSRVHAPDWDRLAALVAAARAAGPDLVIAMPHWGFEYEYWPDARVRTDAHQLIKLGVDVVLGSSPHVLQPIEPVSIDGADPRCPTQIFRGGPPHMGLIAYSLGNFLSIMPTLACRTGAILRLGLRRSPHAWTVSSIAATPTFCGRRVGRTRWLDAGVVTTAESASPAARVHAFNILGAALVP
jgi:hypothetical protein